MNRILIGLLVAGCWTGLGQAEDWPCWRGPRGDGSWQSAKLPEQWPEGGLKPTWKVPIGAGYCGIAVTGGRLYTIDREKLADAPKGGPDGHERVLCLEASSGQRLWSHRYPCTYGGMGGYANGPRAMPTVHDGRVYALGAVGHLFCFEARTGKILWKKDLVVEHKARVPMWGFAASPVIVEDKVIVQAGVQPDGCFIAFDRLTGKEVWRSLADPAGYCTPILIRSQSGPQLVVWTPENVHGLDPASGKRLWTVPYKVTYGVSITPPIFRDDIVFVTGYWEGSKAIRLGDQPADAELIWVDAKQLRGLMAQPLYRDGLVYTMDRMQGLVCFELKTGKRLWHDHGLTAKARNPHASIVWVNDGDRVLILNTEGELILARLTPQGYVEQSRTRLLDGRVWGHPAFAGKHIYAKADGAERPHHAGPFELVCVRIGQ